MAATIEISSVIKTKIKWGERLIQLNVKIEVQVVNYFREPRALRECSNKVSLFMFMWFICARALFNFSISVLVSLGNQIKNFNVQTWHNPPVDMRPLDVHSIQILLCPFDNLIIFVTFVTFENKKKHEPLFGNAISYK